MKREVSVTTVEAVAGSARSAGPFVIEDELSAGERRQLRHLGRRAFEFRTTMAHVGIAPGGSATRAGWEIDGSVTRVGLREAGRRPRRLGTTRKACWFGGVLLFGLLLGACGTSSSRSSSPHAGSTPAASATSSAGALDACLVGTWTDQGEHDTLSYNGTPVAMDGLVGKVVTFSPGGTQTVNFAGASALRGLVGGSTYTVIERGVINDLVTSSAGVLSFADVNFTGFSESATLGAATVSPPQPPPPTPDRYTCGATTLVLSGNGLHATFSRLRR